MICPKDNVEYEKGCLTNAARGWMKVDENAFGYKLAAKLGPSAPITALKCPVCGEIKIYISEKLK